MKSYAGGCLCGEIRYQITADAGPSRVCWCRDCQRISSNGTVNVIFPSNAIKISGVPSRHEKTADSGNTVTRRFCSKCGSQLFSDSSGRPGLTVVRVGTLDEPSTIKPSTNIWVSSAPSWACVDQSLEQFKGPPASASTAKT
ncbi:GFA family protein [Janthinobacterium sp. 17J80-10]|uniref:GFA family protein n=1 Tax=Janthinobacterium sp. 17J80-10 TaxID=2497863 RepID=UPI001005280C|nr:GFA family protein [Janthinobacterium sp. 17J80-10]QAU33421.1 aldehyde-activating protein [Janthinobacterium sp. 17J80-10]